VSAAVLNKLTLLVVSFNRELNRARSVNMKNRWMVSSLVSGALLIVGGYAKQQRAEAVHVNAGPAGKEWTKVMADQEEHKTYQLTAGAHIDVFNISGPVSVEATDGSTAEVSIYRRAPNRDDLAYRKVSVEQTSSGLTIQQKNDGTEHSSIDLLNRVVLKLPRQVSVSGKSISGDFNISGVDGAVNLNGISGSVNAKQLKGALTVSGVSGNVRVAVARVNDAGLRVSGVSRNVYLGLASDLNAELSVGNTTAGVSNKLPDLALVSVGPSNYSGRLGSGGPRIEVSNVTGTIVLHRM
jgi:hypothetical protein